MLTINLPNNSTFIVFKVDSTSTNISAIYSYAYIGSSSISLGGYAYVYI
jgi:hypothetical protein